MFTFSKMAAGMYLEHYLDSKMFILRQTCYYKSFQVVLFVFVQFSFIVLPVLWLIRCRTACYLHSGFRLRLFAGIANPIEGMMACCATMRCMAHIQCSRALEFYLKPFNEQKSILCPVAIHGNA